MTDEDGLRLEAAEQVGFVAIDEDATEYRCTSNQILDLMKRAENAGAIQAACRADIRVNGLLAANNREIEKRRGAVALLREAGGVFRSYEQHHRDKAIGNVHADDRNRKAERNAEIAGHIEAFIDGVHS